MPHRRRRSAPNLLPALSLIAALVLSYPCAQGHAKQGPARPAVSSSSSAAAAAAAAAPAALFSPSPNSPPPSSPPPPSLDDDDDPPDLPSATASGYVPNGGPERGGGQLFYTYYEKRNDNATKTSRDGDDSAPIFLWLEGGPGCASSFGNFYINGPARVLASRENGESGGKRRRATGRLKANPHAWNAVGGLLYIDQPVGTGLSVPGATGAIPRSEVEVAADLYFGLCELFGPGGPLEALAPRPLFVTGESYAGKFVPSIAHYILQAEAEAEEAKTRENRRERRASAASASATARPPPPLRVRRELRWEKDASTGAISPPRPPPFHLAGIAVGNGLVDPGSQVLSHASSLYYRGLIDASERARAMAAALQVSALVRASRFSAAHAARARLLERLTAASGVGTLLDARRYEDYDAGKAVDQYLNIPEVRAALKVNESLYASFDSSSSSSNSSAASSLPYEACSAAVAAAMDADVMRSTAGLFRDVLERGVRVLVYVGADDVQDGAAATDAWLSRLRWGGGGSGSGPGGGAEFRAARRRLWELEEAVVDDERFGSGCTDGEGGAFSPSSSLGGVGGNGGASAVATGSLVDVEERRASLSSSPSSSSSNSSPAAAAPVVGYWRSGGGLDHVTVRNGGHMLPHDQPVVALAMLARWSADVLSGPTGARARATNAFSPSAAAAAAAAE